MNNRIPENMDIQHAVAWARQNTRDNVSSLSKQLDITMKDALDIIQHRADVEELDDNPGYFWIKRR